MTVQDDDDDVLEGTPDMKSAKIKSAANAKNSATKRMPRPAEETSKEVHDMMSDLMEKRKTNVKEEDDRGEKRHADLVAAIAAQSAAMTSQSAKSSAELTAAIAAQSAQMSESISGAMSSALSAQSSQMAAAMSGALENIARMFKTARDST
jgi:hypothetical protein